MPLFLPPAFGGSTNFVICTSTTRPGHQEGLLIYETDTDIARISDGSTWRMIGPPSYSSSPPSNPIHGDEWILPLAGGASWRFVYNAGSAETDKWEFVGGPPLTAWVQETESTVSAGYTDLATVGPRVAAPRAGVYNVRFGAHVSSSAQWAFIGIHNGAAIVIDLDVIVSGMGTQWRGVAYESPAAVTVASAGTFITMKYHTAGGAPSATFRHRWIAVTPLRVS